MMIMMRMGLLLMVVAVVNSTNLDAAHFNIDYSTYCDDTRAAIFNMRLNMFSYTLYPPEPVQVLPDNSLLMTLPPLQDPPILYTLEGVRRNSTTGCTFCPYDSLPDGAYPTAYVSGAYIAYSPMYGPCLDGRKSIKQSCVQHTVFSPPTFLGEYFYPDQVYWSHLQALNNLAHVAEHLLVATDSIVDQRTLQVKQPSEFGLGKSKMQGIIDQNVVKNKGDNQINATLTQQLFGRYRTTFSPSDQNSVDGWLLWAQHNCFAACHRDSQSQMIKIRPQDWEGKPLLQYLGRVQSDNSALPDQHKCTLCPPFSAAYTWPLGNSILRNMGAPNCYPWFGALPALNPSTSLAWVIDKTIPHGALLDGIVQPTTDSQYIKTLPCAVNTYNDVCAHTIQWNTQVYNNLLGVTENDVTQAEINAAPSKMTCKTCPAGSHTDNKTGAWFCIPANGNVFKNRYILNDTTFIRGNWTQYWSRRDRIAYDFECGYRPVHCLQCASVAGMMNGALPDVFNQQMILGPLLQTYLCPSQFYCPHPLMGPDQIACPSTKPWSPKGSWHVDNCTCGRGTFLNASSNVCQICPAWNSCPVGQFRLGWSACMYNDGMKSGGSCQNCTNLPSQNAIYTGPGQDFSTGGSTKGVCPFLCSAYMQLSVLSGSQACFQVYECIALPVFIRTMDTKTYAYQRYYTDLAAQRDSFAVAGSGCTATKTLSIALAGYIASSDNYPLVSASCAGATPAICNTSVPCKVSVDATQGSNVQCTPCASPPAGASFTSDARYQQTDPRLRNLMCLSKCDDSTYYVNDTRCLSCAGLASQICPKGDGKTWHINGGGCMQNFQPFSNMFAPVAADVCTSCEPGFVPVGYYVDLTDCRNHTCGGVSVGQTYYKERCGGTSKGVIANATQIGECNNVTEYLSGSYGLYTSPVCTACIEFKVGSYKTINCSNNLLDTQWALCPAGFYCDGHGGQKPCPYPQTSIVGRSRQDECYCPAGTLRTQDGQCQWTRCSDAQVLSAYAPGGNYYSSQYMQLDANQVTECKNCSGVGSYTLDANAVGAASCRCPYPKAQPGCTSCPPTCLGCWRPGYTCDGSCGVPPFSMTQTGCAVSTCQAPFRVSNPPASEPKAALSMLLTGSAAYVSEANMANGWTRLYTTSDASTITHIGGTSDYNTDGSAQGKQLGFFMIAERPFKMFITPLLSFSYPYNALETDKIWCLFSGDVRDALDRDYQLAQIAVSQWPNVADFNAFYVSGIKTELSAWTAQVVFHKQLGGGGSSPNSLFLYTNQVSFESSGSPVWFTQIGCGVWKDKVLLASSFFVQNCSVPAMQHAFAYPGAALGSKPSAFYVAMNDASLGASVKAYNTDIKALISYTVGGSRRITAMAVLVLASNPVLYLAFDTAADGTITRLQWLSAAAGQLEERIELFYTAGQTVLSLSSAWASDQIFWARMAVLTPLGQIDPHSIVLKTADKDYQRTFTEVQDMPLSTRPSIGPLLIPTSTFAGLLVVAHGSSIFTLPIGRCIPTAFNTDARQPTYWEPVRQKCIMHSCLRDRSCNTQTQFYNTSLQVCVCKAGYYATSSSGAPLQCSVCPLGYYCTGQTTPTNLAIKCPTTMTTISTQSVSAMDCVCSLGNYYKQGTAQCAACPAGSWCPNQWQALTCPGNVDTQRSIVDGTEYPHACVCAVGSTGPSCSVCPSGNRCPVTLCATVNDCPSTAKTTNYALSLKIRLLSATTTTTEIVCPQAYARVVQHFNGQGFQWFCVYVPAVPSRTSHHLLALMVQTTQAGSSYASRLSSIWLNFTTSDFVVDAVQPSADNVAQAAVYSNAPVACLTGKASLPDGTACVCDVGYATIATGCSQCGLNTFKNVIGVGTCIPCASGMTSVPGSSVCVSPSNSKNSNNSTGDGGGGSSSSATNVAAIAGGVVGGVALLGVLLFGFNQYYAGVGPPSSASTTTTVPLLSSSSGSRA